MSERLRSLFNWFRRSTPRPESGPGVDPQLLASLRHHLQSSSTRYEWAPHRFTITKVQAGCSLAAAMATQFAMPKSYLQHLVARHDVMVERPIGSEWEQVRYGAGLKVQEGDRVTVTGAVLPETRPTVDWSKVQEQSAESIKQQLQPLILHEDDRVVILNKPSGLPVQPGPGAACSLDALARLYLNSELRVVHRLDKDASGVIILAKTSPSATELRRRLDEAHIDPQIEKIYWAMAVGKPEMALGEVISSVYVAGRYPKERMTTHRTLRQSLLDSGKSAITQWRHLGTYVKRHATGRRVKCSLLEMRPLTGRKHQLRIHCAEQLEMPILGDAKYGFEQLRAACISPRPLHLHCYQVRLRRWNADGSDLIVTAPVPPHFIRTMVDYPLFLPKRPKTHKPRFKSNVRKLYQRTLN